MTSLENMLKATELVRSGRLQEATDLINARLREESSPQSKAQSSGGATPNQSIGLSLSRAERSSRFADVGRMIGGSRILPFKPAGLGIQQLDGLPAPLARARRPDAPIPTGASFTAHSCASPHGELSYKLYVPSGYRGESVPLLVMLHGCTQSPDDFAAGTQMNAVAEERNLLVAYPMQPQSANLSKCWNWFRRGDQQRGNGEPAMIAAMTRQIMEQYSVRSDQVYAAGLSAGGAAAAILGATYSDIYAAVGVHSGLACGAAHDVPSALTAMRNGGSPSLASVPSRPVRMIVFHGDGDKTVNPVNSEIVLSQYQTKDPGLTTTTIKGRAPGGLPYTRMIQRDKENVPQFEKWVIHGAGHAWSGGSLNGSYTEPRGPDASREMLRFFLDDGKQS